MVVVAGSGYRYSTERPKKKKKSDMATKVAGDILAWKTQGLIRS
jgi:hypothetical protein